MVRKTTDFKYPSADVQLANQQELSYFPLAMQELYMRYAYVDCKLFGQGLASKMCLRSG